MQTGSLVKYQYIVPYYNQTQVEDILADYLLDTSFSDKFAIPLCGITQHNPRNFVFCYAVAKMLNSLTCT